MHFKERFVLFLKGMCMGSADVVPGVSGGTIALLLGIYERFISALRSLDFRWLKPLLCCFREKFSASSREELLSHFRAMDLAWLMTLLLGLVSAFAVASVVIPKAMERQPEMMFAFFFGLVLASVSAPLRMMERFSYREFLISAFFFLIFFLLLGSQLPIPTDGYIFVVEKDGSSLGDILLQRGSLYAPYDLWLHAENEPLRAILDRPDLSRSNIQDLILPAHSELFILKPQRWYIFLCGFLAICAMLLPGISGSFILLVLGLYYYILNSLKRFFHSLAGGHFLLDDFINLALFVCGISLGIVLFSRALHYLFKRSPQITLAAIIGIMLGSLRPIWPFKSNLANGDSLNVLPSFDSIVFFKSTLAFVLGVGVVVFIHLYSKRVESRRQITDKTS